MCVWMCNAKQCGNVTHTHTHTHTHTQIYILALTSLMELTCTAPELIRFTSSSLRP